MAVTVRNFEEQDVAELKRLKTLSELELHWSPPEVYIEEFVKTVMGISRRDLRLAKVAVVEGKTVGYCIAAKEMHTYNGVVLDITMDSAYIWDIYVLKEFRGKDVGKRLLESIVQHLKETGKKNVFLIVNVWNEDGKRFFEANGFRKWGYFLRRRI